jgi:hypothetical protein
MHSIESLRFLWWCFAAESLKNQLAVATAVVFSEGGVIKTPIKTSNSTKFLELNSFIAL